MEVKGATIGPDSWKLSTVKNLKLAQAVVQRSDKFNDLGRQLDPLPSLRDNCIQQSNAQIHAYVRSTRQVVIKLRDSLLDTEEEIKSLLRGKESLERALEHIRKDIILNRDSSSSRRARPSRERDPDGASDLLNAERTHYRKLKRVLEGQLRSIQKQLQVLDNGRKRLKAVLSERNRVLDLLCHAASSAKGPSHQEKVRNGETMSALPRTPEVNPLGPYTPEASEAISLAASARQRSVTLRREVTEVIDQVNKLQRAAHKSVNDGLTQKIAETVTMKQHLQMTSGETRMAIHRGERWHYATDVARGYTLGPVSSQDLTTRERLDRPMVKVYQRHPGTQLPEAEEIIEGNNGLQESLDAIGRNIGMLKLTQGRIRDDIKDKHTGSQIDANVVRMRRRKANHRWVIGGIGC